MDQHRSLGEGQAVLQANPSPHPPGRAECAGHPWAEEELTQG